MRWGLGVAAALLAAGCTRIDVDQGGAYACAQDSGTPEKDCPAGWRCGFGGFCFSPDAGRDYRCAVAARDCAAGWQCGLEGLCLDPANPRDYPCADSARDCTGGWYCGARGRCYERRDAGAEPCRPTEALDCADGWRCGVKDLDEVCHPLDAGAPYPCRLDSDCEAAWRCGPDGRCLDAAADALRPNPGSAAAGTLFSPATEPGPVDRVEGADKVMVAGCPTLSATSVTLVRGALLTKRLDYPYPGRPAGCLPDGGADPDAGAAHLDMASISLSTGAPRDLADLGLSTVLATSAGQLLEARFQPPAPPTLSAFPNPTGIPNVTGLKFRDTTLLAFGDTRVGLWDGGTWRVPGAIPQLFDGGTQILDVELDEQPGQHAHLYAATTHGLYLHDLGGSTAPDGGPWRPIFDGCKTDRPITIRRVNVVETGTTSRGLSMEIDRTESGTRSDVVRMRSFLPAPGPLSCNRPFDAMPPAGATQYFWDDMRDVADCSSGLRTEALRITPSQYDGGTWDLMFRCVNPADGGTDLRYATYPSSTISLGPQRLASELNDPATAFSGRNSRLLVAAARHGQLWWVSGQKGLALSALNLTRLPASVFGTAEAPSCAVDGLSVTAGGGPSRTIEHPSIAGHVRGQGFVADSDPTQRAMPPFAPVVGRPNWYATYRPAGAKPAALAVLDRRDEVRVTNEQALPHTGILLVSASEAPVPTALAAGSSADGGTVLVVGSGDTLWAADLGSAPAGGYDPLAYMALSPAPQLVLADVPRIRATITSLVVARPPPTPAPGARYATAWLVASGRVFRVRADSLNIWRSDEVIADPGEAVQVFADGPRVRVGYRDGSVYGLPSRVQLAPKLPEGTAREFAVACGNTVALGTTGPWRLQVTAGLPEGTWERLPLATADAGLAPGNGKLHSDGTSALLFREHGVVERIAGLTCLPAE